MKNPRPYSTSRSLRLLILGGTGFIGPWFVRFATERGHKVTVFNRGESRADLPAAVERLAGDRAGSMTALAGREWDAVIDLSTYGPGWIRGLGEVIGSCGHYTFISTISVYDDPARNPWTAEASPVRVYRGGDDPYTRVGEAIKALVNRGNYGALKILCEEEAERLFPGRTLVLRCGHIVGPGDPFGALTYWPTRMRQGGEVLVAGDPLMPVQFIDVRDVAAFAINSIEQHVTGVLNVTAPASQSTFFDLLETARSVASVPAALTWVSSAWLAQRADASINWGNVLVWTPEQVGLGGAMRMRIDKALAAGLAPRPIAATLKDVMAWHDRKPVAERARTISGRVFGEDGRWQSIWQDWPELLTQERKTLECWHAESTSVRASAKPDPVGAS